jgi:hypothetical protein
MSSPPGLHSNDAGSLNYLNIITKTLRRRKSTVACQNTQRNLKVIVVSPWVSWVDMGGIAVERACRHGGQWLGVAALLPTTAQTKRGEQRKPLVDHTEPKGGIIHIGELIRIRGEIKDL